MQTQSQPVNLNEVFADLDAHKMLANELLTKTLALSKELLLSRNAVKGLEEMVESLQGFIKERDNQMEILKTELETLKLQVNCSNPIDPGAQCEAV